MHRWQPTDDELPAMHVSVRLNVPISQCLDPVLPPVQMNLIKNAKVIWIIGRKLLREVSQIIATIVRRSVGAALSNF